MEKSFSESYKQAGVDVTAGYKSVELMKEAVKSTYNKNVISDLGGFGGLFALNEKEIKEPILVSGTDGAKPLFFLDYMALGKNIPEVVATIVKGVTDGCKMAGCSLVGGETAEMPGFYQQGEYDLAGFCVGVVEKEKILNNKTIEVGDKVIGIASSGVHSNGFSLVRKIFNINEETVKEYKEELGMTLGEALLTPTKIYVKAILELLQNVEVKGISHITGGGFYENMPRMLRDNISIEIKKDSFMAKAMKESFY